MIDWTEIAFEALPALLGLAIVLYVFYRISRMEHFFEVVRSWIVLLFVVSLAGLWSVELIMDTTGSSFDDLHIKMDMTFVIFSSWLSVCVVLLWTTHGRYNDVDMFVPWFKKNPRNLISAWGILGIVLVAMTWASDLSPETILRVSFG
jgi:formate hydrogenlyase subunit 4